MSKTRTLDPDVEAMAFQYGLELMMPTKVLRLAKGIGEPVASGKIGKGRMDLRKLALVTIDGEDARDFDDAVHCECVDGNAFRLTVVIADVSHFVTEGDGLDQEAYSRGTSAYFPNMVLPMFPERLSEDLCSLRPGVDRLGLGFQAVVKRNGKVRDQRFFECVIRSKKRLTYGQVQETLDGNRPVNGEVDRSLHSLAELCAVLESVRRKRGGLQIDVPTTVPVIANGQVSGFVLEERFLSHRIIEECMLLANTSAAKYLIRKGYQFLYRVHPVPPAAKIARLRTVLGEMGVKAGDLSTAKGLTEVAGKFRNRTPLLASVMASNVLRTLESAVYTPDNNGHFGLGYDDYAHFTSPIRRYPDLMVHRTIKAAIRGEPPAKNIRERLRTIGAHCTEREQASDRASWNVISRKLGRSMYSKVGNEVLGVISGMSKGGMFVSLEGGADGMIRFSGLNDYYVLDPTKTQVTGKRRKRKFHVGMEVKVRIDEVNRDDGRCTLKLS